MVSELQQNSSLSSARGYEGFSRQHRERVSSSSFLKLRRHSKHISLITQNSSLVMGSGPSQAGSCLNLRNKTRARITVVVRKRPLTVEEIERNEQDILSLFSHDNGIIVDEPRKNVIGVPYIEPHEFLFDRAYGENHTNFDVYSTCVRHLVDAVFQERAKCACFAYGQTGSGKTYTMVGCGPMKRSMETGDNRALHETHCSDAGLLELAAEDCFRWLATPQFECDYGLYVSFYEIYCNKVYDLLNKRHLVRALETNLSGNVVVKDLRQFRVENLQAFERIIKSGLENRIMGINSKNNDSSRGHAILTLQVKNQHDNKIFGKLVFVDLAGSERGVDAMGSVKQTQTDGAGINRSLLALKECIRALDLQSAHVPFRDSELTKVLRDMFVGSTTRTLMISCVSPSSACCEQTLNTLRYADRVKAMRRSGNTAIPETFTSNTIESSSIAMGSVITPKVSTSQKKSVANGSIHSSHVANVGPPKLSSLHNEFTYQGHPSLSPLKSTRECFTRTGKTKPSVTRSSASTMKQNSLPVLTKVQEKDDPCSASSSFLSSSFSSCSSHDQKKGVPNTRSSKETEDVPKRTQVFQKRVRPSTNNTNRSSRSTHLSKSTVQVTKSPMRPFTDRTRKTVDSRHLSDGFHSKSAIFCGLSHKLQKNERYTVGSTKREITLNTYPRRSHFALNQDKDHLDAAASILRKRFEEWNFPLVPEKKGPGKYIEHDTAVKMIRGMAALKPQEITKFVERYQGTIKNFYLQLLKNHEQFLDSQRALMNAQQVMLESIQAKDNCGSINLTYIDDLRNVVQTHLALSIRLGKRVTEMERMLSLQHTLTNEFLTIDSHCPNLQREHDKNKEDTDLSPKLFDGVEKNVCLSPHKELVTTSTTSVSHLTINKDTSSNASSTYVLSPLCEEEEETEEKKNMLFPHE